MRNEIFPFIHHPADEATWALCWMLHTSVHFKLHFMALHIKPRMEKHLLFSSQHICTITQVDHQTSHRCQCGKCAPTAQQNANWLLSLYKTSNACNLCDLNQAFRIKQQPPQVGKDILMFQGGLSCHHEGDREEGCRWVRSQSEAYGILNFGQWTLTGYWTVGGG